MAFPTSYVNGRTLRDGLYGTAINLDTDTIKVALYTSSISGTDKNAVEAQTSAPFTSNQVTSSNYSAGGSSLTNPSTTTPSAGKWIFQDSAATLAWSNVTFSPAGAIVYDSTASSRVLAAINFGTPQDVVAGSFTITWDPTNGIFYATY